MHMGEDREKRERKTAPGRACARASDGTPSQNGRRSNNGYTHLTSQRRLIRTGQSLPAARGAIKGPPLVCPGPASATAAESVISQRPGSPAPKGGSEMRVYAAVPEPPKCFAVHVGYPVFFLPFFPLHVMITYLLPAPGSLSLCVYVLERETKRERDREEKRERGREKGCVPLCFGSVSSAYYLDYIHTLQTRHCPRGHGAIRL